MDPIRNKRVIMEACRAVGLPYDERDSPSKLLSKLMYGERTPKRVKGLTVSETPLSTIPD